MVCIGLDLWHWQQRKQAGYAQLSSDRLLWGVGYRVFSNPFWDTVFYNCFGGKIRKIMEERIS